MLMVPVNSIYFQHVKTMRSRCSKCGRYIKLAPQLVDLINRGIIKGLSINICVRCANLINAQNDRERNKTLKQ